MKFPFKPGRMSTFCFQSREKNLYRAAFFGPHLREYMTAIDAGANIGKLTLFFCNRVGAQGQVFAFELEPDNFRELVRSIEHNHIKWFTPLNLAVGASDAPASLTFGLNGYIRPDRAGEPNGCMVSLDSFAAQRAMPSLASWLRDVERGSALLPLVATTARRM
jgi:FkbM family methyltransferase